MKLRRKLSFVALAAVLVLSVPGLVLAQNPAQGPKGPVLWGRIQAKSSGGFTLGTPSGEITVSVDAGTRYRVPGVEQPTLANLHIGDSVLVLGRRNEVGAFVARVVAVLPPVPIRSLKGEVTEIQGQTLTVAVPGGQKVLTTDERTVYHVPDVEEPTLVDIQVGSRVFALVDASDAEAWLAKLVAVIPQDARGPVSLRGRVTDVAETALRVRMRENVVTVAITDSTRIRVPGVENPTIADIRIGDWVLVVGHPTGLCRIQARAVGVLPPVSAHRFVVRGEVLTVAASTLTVQDPNDTHTIRTDDKTRFRVPDVEEPTILDIQVGDHIVAVGTPEDDGALLARLILVRRPPRDEPTAPPAGQLPLT